MSLGRGYGDNSVRNNTIYDLSTNTFCLYIENIEIHQAIAVEIHNHSMPLQGQIVVQTASMFGGNSPYHNILHIWVTSVKRIPPLIYLNENL